MSPVFTVTCDSCGEKAKLKGGFMYSGLVDASKIQLELELDEEEVSDSRLVISCINCGNSFDVNP